MTPSNCMRSKHILILTIYFILLGGAGGFLWRIQSGQKLGNPGVRIVAEPVYDEFKALAATNSIFLPRTVLDTISSPLEVTRQELNWLPPDTLYGRRRYLAADGFGVDVSVVLMGRDRTSIHKPQYCLAGQGFRIDRTERTTVSIPLPRPYALPVMKLTTTKQVRMNDGRTAPVRGLYVYWFLTDRKVTADHFERMWWMARGMVAEGVLQRWAYVACFSVCPPGEEETTFARMTGFLADAVPRFQLVEAGSSVQGGGSPGAGSEDRLPTAISMR